MSEINEIDFVVSKIKEASQDGGPYVYVARTTPIEPKSTTGGEVKRSSSSPFGIGVGTMKNLPKAMLNMVRGGISSCLPTFKSV